MPLSIIDKIVNFFQYNKTRYDKLLKLLNNFIIKLTLRDVFMDNIEKFIK